MAEASSAFAATSVKLLIKASNQEFEDQIVDTQLLWTVRRLKTHLSQVYPSNPSVSEQKLIYSGQLLADNLLLKDVIRNYKDVDTQNHIFHLVYTPRNPLQNLSVKKAFSMSQQQQQQKQQNAANFSYENDKPSTSKAATVSNDGLRHRNIQGGMTANVSATAHHQYSQVQQKQQQQEQKPQIQQNSSSKNCYPNSATFSSSSSQSFNDNKSKSSFVDIPEIMSNGKYPQYYHQPHNPNALQFIIPPQEDINAMIAQRDAMYNWLQKVYNQYQEQCLLLAKLPSYAQNFSINNSKTETNDKDKSSSTSPLNPKGSNDESFIAASNNYMPNPFFQQMPFLMQNIPSFGGFFPGINPFTTDFNNINSSNNSSSNPTTTNADRVLPSSSSAAASTHSVSTGSNPIQAVPVIQPTTTNATATTTTTQATSQVTAQDQQQAEPAAVGGAGGGVGGAGAAAAAAQQMPRFPNIVEEEHDNRDWLDNFYSAIRLLALLTLVYFYSSPMRCLVVAIIAVGIYLYHNGFFYIRRPAEANNNNINNNNNIGANQIRQGVQEVQQHQQQEQQQQQQQQQSATSEQDKNTESVSTSSTNNRNETENSTPLLSSSVTSSNIVSGHENTTNSVIAFVQTFVVSFFTSLLPETAAL